MRLFPAVIALFLLCLGICACEPDAPTTEWAAATYATMKAAIDSADGEIRKGVAAYAPTYAPIARPENPKEESYAQAMAALDAQRAREKDFGRLMEQVQARPDVLGTEIIYRMRGDPATVRYGVAYRGSYPVLDERRGVRPERGLQRDDRQIGWGALRYEGKWQRMLVMRSVVPSGRFEFEVTRYFHAR
jgi:hypothetical protein